MNAKLLNTMFVVCEQRLFVIHKIILEVYRKSFITGVQPEFGN